MRSARIIDAHDWRRGVRVAQTSTCRFPQGNSLFPAGSVHRSPDSIQIDRKVNSLQGAPLVHDDRASHGRRPVLSEADYNRQILCRISL